MPVTIHEVAKRAGGGIGTVSSVVNNSRPVSEETRQKVLTAIEELNFVPNPSGRRLSIGRTHMIAGVFPFFVRVSQFERLRGVMSVVGKSDYDISLFVVETTAQRTKVLQTVPHHGRIDGLLIFSFVPNEADIRQIHQHDIPTVLIGAFHPELHSIVLNDAVAAQAAVQHLLDLGHQKIAYLYEYLDEPFTFPSGRARYQGYCQALESAGISLNPKYHCQGSYSYEQGRQTALDLLKLSNPPTAILTYSDQMALTVLKAARDLNLEVPGDLSIISYEDTELAQAAQITAVRQHLFESGVQGVELLLKAIDRSDTSPTCFQLPVELVIRQTTARPVQL